MPKTPGWKKVNSPSTSMREHYAKMFKRNQMKFMRRSVLDPEHIGSEFLHEGKKYKLLGTVDPLEMIIESLEDGSCYIVHCDLVTRCILGS